MNPKTTKSPQTATRSPRPRQSGDEPDDPGPSRSGAVSGALRIAGEAVHEIDHAWLGDHLAQAAALLTVPVKCVNVEVVYDQRMTKLHEQHLSINETTDVLTFPTSENDESIEADIVVCLDEARWRADQFDHAVERELLLYSLHGLLHCAGFDDHDEASFAAMHAEEDRILEAIGVGRTFWAAVGGATVGGSGAGGPETGAGHDAPSASVSESSGEVAAPPAEQVGHGRDRGIDD